MNKLLMFTMALSVFTMLSANQPAEAARFSLYLGGGPTYVAPGPYYYDPVYVAPRYVVEPYYVQPVYPRYYYHAPRYYRYYY